MTALAAIFMFTLPTLATDNFYKFLTISGLALVLFSFYSIDVSNENFKKLYKETKSDIKEVNEKFTEYNFKLSQINYYTIILNSKSEKDRFHIADSLVKADTINNRNLKVIISNRLVFIDTTRELIKKRIVSLINSLDTLSIPLVTTFDDYTRNSMDLDRELSKKNPVALIFLIMGLIILTIGLTMWYRKHQLLHDRILAKQANIDPRDTY